jgi:hypothetical protein
MSLADELSERGEVLAVALFDDVAVSPVGNVSGVGNAPPVGFGGGLRLT